MNKKSILLSHPTGNANVRAVLDGLHSANMLHSFHTSVASYPNNIFGKLCHIPGCREFLKRSYPFYTRSYTKLYPYRELGRMLANKLNIEWLIAHEKGIFSVDQLYHSVDRRISNYIRRQSSISAVYAYEDGALASFKMAAEKGIFRFYDLPTGYWKANRVLLQQEIERRPEWADTFTGFRDSPDKLERKDQELNLANTIYVASTFTADTLKYYAAKLSPVEIIPYGFPAVEQSKVDIKLKRLKDGKKIKMLFVGKLSQQKGIADVFEVIKKYKNHVQLTLIGSLFDNKVLHQEIKRYNYLGTLPHHKVLEQMEQHDVLLFPSLFDGFGMVMTEAMSQGTPVIASDRCAGPDIIRHGENGWLMKAGETESLDQIIHNIIGDTKLIKDVSRSAASTASQRPWHQYGADVAASISKKL